MDIHALHNFITVDLESQSYIGEIEEQLQRIKDLERTNRANVAALLNSGNVELVNRLKILFTQLGGIKDRYYAHLCENGFADILDSSKTIKRYVLDNSYVNHIDDISSVLASFAAHRDGIISKKEALRSGANFIYGKYGISKNIMEPMVRAASSKR